MIKKILIFLITLTFICFLIFYINKDKLNINKILETFKNNTNIIIKLKNEGSWSYYPKIIYKNNLSINDKENNLFIEDSNIIVARSYGVKSPFIINFKSPSISYKGINFRNSRIDLLYHDNIIDLNNLTANVIDGNIDIQGSLNLNDKNNVYLQGSYNNISLNRIFKQLNLASWERVKIKISSSNFKINTKNGTPKKIIQNLNGEMNISGSLFFVSTEEEQFGAAFLSLLADKISDILSISKSINYLLKKFADIPSNISGKININQGVLIAEKLLIKNKKAKALLSVEVDLKNNLIDGKIDFYENNIIFLALELKGDIENPEILIGGEVFFKEDSKPQYIKEVFEEGIQSLVDKTLKIND